MVKVESNVFTKIYSHYLGHHTYKIKLKNNKYSKKKYTVTSDLKHSDRPHHELMSTVPKYDTEKLLTMHTNWRPLKIMITTIQCHRRTTTIWSNKSSHPQKTPVMKKKINIYQKIELPGFRIPSYTDWRTFLEE